MKVQQKERGVDKDQKFENKKESVVMLMANNNRMMSKNEKNIREN